MAARPVGDGEAAAVSRRFLLHVVPGEEALSRAPNDGAAPLAEPRPVFRRSAPNDRACFSGRRRR